MVSIRNVSEERRRMDGCLQSVMYSHVRYDYSRDREMSVIQSDASLSRFLRRILVTDSIARLCSYPFKPTDQGGLDSEELIPSFRI